MGKNVSLKLFLIKSFDLFNFFMKSFILLKKYCSDTPTREKTYSGSRSEINCMQAFFRATVN